jgi:hypothetical protein
MKTLDWYHSFLDHIPSEVVMELFMSTLSYFSGIEFSP